MKRIISISAAILLPLAVMAFDVRAFHLDLRAQVMTPAALRSVADKAAASGINTIIMEWEATFPFVENAVLCNSLAYSRDEVDGFISYCGALGIDVIPLQNCFGHCEYILRHPRYAGLRESSKDYSQVCPLKKSEARRFFTSIFSEIASAHPSDYIHIGCDETRLLGDCRNCRKEDASRLFVDYVAEMCSIVRELGKIPIIWGDMILQHPEYLSELPKDLVIVDWNYGWEPSHFGNIDEILAAGYEMWGAPALRSSPDNIYLTDWRKHLNNLETYIPYCIEKGFSGIVETSWSTSGVYGYIRDCNQDVVDLQPIRQVYPLCAFGLLQDAFCDAISNSSFSARKFIREYASNHFGLSSEADLNTVEDYFMTGQSIVTGSSFKEETIRQELASAESLRRRMSDIRVSSEGRRDWNQLILAIDIRINYLKFKTIEYRFEFQGKDPSIPSDLKVLFRESSTLRRRFQKLNGWYLKDTSAPLGEWSYVQKIKNLYDILK